MSRSRSLTSLTDDVRKAADIENATGRFPDPEIWEYINQSIARLYTDLDRLDNQYYFTQSTFNTADGVKAYTLPADFWVLKGVTVTLTSGNPVNKLRAQPYMAEEGVWLDSVGNWISASYPVMYRLAGNNIQFSPIPKGVYTVTLDYTSAPQRLTLGSDTFDGIAGFDRWVILDAAIKVKQKDSLDPGSLMAEKAELTAWVSSLSQRDTGRPQRVYDVQSEDIFSNYIGPYSPFGW